MDEKSYVCSLADGRILLFEQYMGVPNEMRQRNDCYRCHVLDSAKEFETAYGKRKIIPFFEFAGNRNFYARSKKENGYVCQYGDSTEKKWEFVEKGNDYPPNLICASPCYEVYPCVEIERAANILQWNPGDDVLFYIGEKNPPKERCTVPELFRKIACLFSEGYSIVPANILHGISHKRVAQLFVSALFDYSISEFYQYIVDLPFDRAVSYWEHALETGDFKNYNRR